MIWIFGPTAVGKKTLLLGAGAPDPSHPIRKMFNLDRDVFIPVVVSNLRKGWTKEKNIADRKRLFDVLFSISADWHFGICGQFIDIPDTLRWLKNKYPEHTKYCVYLNVDVKTSKERFLKRHPGIRYTKKRARMLQQHKEKYIPLLKEVFTDVIIYNPKG